MPSWSIDSSSDVFPAELSEHTDNQHAGTASSETKNGTPTANGSSSSVFDSRNPNPVRRLKTRALFVYLENPNPDRPVVSTFLFCCLLLRSATADCCSFNSLLLRLLSLQYRNCSIYNMSSEEDKKSEDDDLWPGGYTPLADVEILEYSTGPTHDDSSEDEEDFRSIADQALSVLEDDYRRTLALRPSLPEEPLPHSEPLPPITLDPHRFETHFPEVPATVPEPRPLPFIDTDAVRRAVAQLTIPPLLPHHHTIIPKQPLQAFHRSTPKAQQATARLTRSATLAEALVRLDLLRSQPTLRIHLLGCDHVECDRSTLAPLVRWLTVAPEAPNKVEFHLIGPNVTKNGSESLLAQPTGRLQKAQAIFVPREYGNTHHPPDLRLAFHAGLWGYDSWKPTLQWMVEQNHQVPLVVTAYTIQEAEDDAEVVHELDCECLWEASPNLYGSQVVRPTQSSNNVYRENAAWQAWRI